MEPTQSKATSAGAISLTRCAFSYHYDGRAPVFTDVDLDVPRGARVVLVGANGAGKSTLLRIIGGRRKRSAGDAHVFGEDAFEHTALTLRVNLVTADWEDSLTLPVRQIVTAAVAAASASAARVAQLLDVLGLAPLLTAELHALSDGQRRRVQLFCKLLPERELILLDEATNSLDVLSRAALLAFLRTEAEARGATVIFCTHIFDGLDGWATSVAHLDGGRLRRHVDASALPAGASLYQIVTQWLLEYAREAAAACEAAAAAAVGYAAERGSSTEAAAAAAAAAAAGVNLSLSEQLAAALLAAASGSTGRLDMLLSSRPVGGGGWGPIVATNLIVRGNAFRETVGSVNAVEFFVTLSASVTFFLSIGLGHWQVIAGLALGGVIAAPFGAYLTKKLPQRPMMVVVGVLVICMSLRTLLKALGYTTWI